MDRSVPALRGRSFRYSPVLLKKRPDAVGTPTTADGYREATCGSPSASRVLAGSGVPFQRPQLPAVGDIEAYFEASRSAGWFSNRGPCFELLAARIEGLVGVPAEPLANATLAIALALRAATNGLAADRREVLLPSFTFVAGAAAILYAGYLPVFFDVEPDGWHPDPHALEHALERRGRRVRAVLACSTFGTPPPTRLRRAWEACCGDAGVPLVVDSAAGFGAVDESGHPLGSQGSAEVFSFHATKPLAIGEGGVVTSSVSSLLARVGSLANFGFAPDRTLTEVGLNAKLDEWHAATALAALDELPAVLAARARRASTLSEQLQGLPVVGQLGGERSTHQFVPLLVDDARARSRVLEAGRRRAVEIRTYFDPPLHRMTPFASCTRVGTLEVTEWLADRCLSLPMANDLRDDEIEAIAGAVAEGLGR